MSPSSAAASSSASDAGCRAPVASAVNHHPQVVAAHRRGSLAMAAPGLLGVALAPAYIAWIGLTPLDVLLFAVMYWLTLGVGLSVGFHRHFSHGAFQTSRPVRWLLAVLGSMGAQGALAYWVSVHRRHHERSDVEGDPHSPHLSGDGGGLRGLWHAHFGWSLTYGLPNTMHYCPDIVREPYLMAVSRQYRRWVVLGLALPAIVGGVVSGTWEGALGGLLWGGLVRQFASSHMTWALNSIGHRFGTRPYDTNDRSTNVAWLALPSLGEMWHNNHHAFPSSAAHGLRWWQVDLNYAFIRLLELLRLAWKVKRPAGAHPESR